MHQRRPTEWAQSGRVLGFQDLRQSTAARLCATAAFAILTLFAVGPAQARALEDGHKACLRGERDRAIVLFRRAVKEDKGERWALAVMWLGKCLREQAETVPQESEKEKLAKEACDRLEHLLGILTGTESQVSTWHSLGMAYRIRAGLHRPPSEKADFAGRAIDNFRKVLNTPGAKKEKVQDARRELPGLYLIQGEAFVSQAESLAGADKLPVLQRAIAAFGDAIAAGLGGAEREKTNKRLAELHFGVGELENTLGQYKEALASFARAEKLGRNDAQLYFAMGTSRVGLAKAAATADERQMHMEAAVECLQKAWKQQPEAYEQTARALLAETYIVFARQACQRQDYLTAERDYTEARKWAALPGAVLLSISRCRLFRGDFAGTLSALDEAKQAGVDVDGDAEARQLRRDLLIALPEHNRNLLRENNLVEARAALDRAADWLFPEDADGHYALGRAYWEVAEALKEAGPRAETRERAFAFLGKAEQLGQANEVARQARQFVKECSLAVAREQQERGDFEGAIEQYEKILNDFGPGPEVELSLAECYTWLARKKTDYETLTQRETLAYYYWDRAQKSGAPTGALEAVRSQMIDILSQAGEALRQQGDYEHARILLLDCGLGHWRGEDPRLRFLAGDTCLQLALATRDEYRGRLFYWERAREILAALEGSDTAGEWKERAAGAVLRLRTHFPEVVVVAQTGGWTISGRRWPEGVPEPDRAFVEAQLRAALHLPGSNKITDTEWGKRWYEVFPPGQDWETAPASGERPVRLCVTGVLETSGTTSAAPVAPGTTWLASVNVKSVSGEVKQSQLYITIQVEVSVTHVPTGKTFASRRVDYRGLSYAPAGVNRAVERAAAAMKDGSTRENVQSVVQATMGAVVEEARKRAGR